MLRTIGDASVELIWVLNWFEELKERMGGADPA